MIAIPEHLPEDIEVLKDIILELVSSNKSFSNRIEYLEREIRYLQEENKLLLQKMFGSKREKSIRLCCSSKDLI
jgi:prefoldin subunit 5